MGLTGAAKTLKSVVSHAARHDHSSYAVTKEEQGEQQRGQLISGGLHLGLVQIHFFSQQQHAGIVFHRLSGQKAAKVRPSSQLLTPLRP
jgi:hypothetical protein